MMNLKNRLEKIKLKDKRYMYGIISLPFVLFLTFNVMKHINDNKKEDKVIQDSISTSLGEVEESILTKNDAYDDRFENTDYKTRIMSLSEDMDSVEYYEQLPEDELNKIDSLEQVNKMEREKLEKILTNKNTSTKEKNTPNSSTSDESEEIIRMMNERQALIESQTIDNVDSSDNYENENEDQKEMYALMKDQLLFMDSLENAKNPEYQRKKALEEQKARREKELKELNEKTIEVTKKENNNAFNTISNEINEDFIKAVIDEDIKGYLKSRVPFRILDDIYLGDLKIEKSSVIYGEITGFELQRVFINIYSIKKGGEIYNVNLSIYDNDGLKGIYIPNSLYREMVNEFGSSTRIQGRNVSQQEDFFESLASQAFNSASNSIAKIIRSNKAKLKFNTHIYLVNEKIN